MKDKAPSIKKAEQREHYPVSLQQEGVYLQSMLDPDNTVWNTSHSWRYTGPFDLDAFKDAVHDLIRRHASLRTRFFLYKEEILQAVAACETVSLDSYYTFEDLSSLPKEDRVTAARKIEKATAKRPYALASDPLIRFTVVRIESSDHVIVIGKHHIISDATSRQLLWRELVTFYNGRVTGEPFNPEPLEIHYHDYAVWEREFVNSPQYLEEKKYWLGELDGPLPLLNLPTDFPRGEDRRAGATIRQEVLDSVLTNRLRSFGLRNRMTFSTAFLTAFYLLLSKYCGQSDIVMGGLYRGRKRDKNLSRIIGLFANRIAMRLNLDVPGDLCVKELLARVDKKIVGAYKNQDFLFEDLIRTIHPPRTETHAPVFQAVFNMVKVPGAHLDFHGPERREWHGFELDTNISSQYDLSLYIRDDLKTLTVKLLYSKNLFRAETIERILAGYITVLSEIVTHPGKELSGLDMVTAEEKQRLLYDLNNTAVDYPAEKTIHQLLEEQAARTPGAVALSMSYRTYTAHMTYKELNRKAGHLAYLLPAKGVGPGSIVGLKVERSFEMMVGIYGILKAGAAYLPIDPTYPEDRIDYMLKDSNAKLVLSELSRLNALPATAASNPQPAAIFSNLAYVIYTSGSTGRPKGVMIPHRAVHNFFIGMAGLIDFAPRKTILALTTISFDIFVLETLLPLSRGPRVVIANEKQQMDMNALETLMVKTNVEMIQATPTRMQMFVSTNTQPSCLKGLKEIMVGGEPFPLPLLEDLKRLTSAGIYNMYGPTETTVWSAVRDLTGAEAVDIGRPIANTQILILDKHHNLQPGGVPGELYIAGHGLALGYANRPKLTAERFFNRSYKTYKSDRTYTLYRTGDMARWLPRGNIEHLGRIDNQVKIRGFRIEPGEIEAVLDNHPAVTESVVLARESGPATMSLYAYVVPANEETLDISGLRDYLSQTLPPYMVPSYFVNLDKIPLTQNGKVNRNALPTPGADAFIGADSGYEAPETRLQEKMVSVWQDVLGLERVGIDDNFIAMGGDSIKAIQVSSRLNTHGYKLDIAVLFKHQTIRTVSPYVEKTAAGEKTALPPKTLSPDRWGETLETIQNNFHRENIDNIYYLSPMQEGMLFHYLYDPGNHAYIVQINYLLEGDVDTALFEKSCRQLVKRHDVFRTAFVHDRLKRPVQVVLKDRETAYSYHDLSHLPGAFGDGAEHIRRIAAGERERGFDLLEDTLIRFTLIKTSGNTYWLLVTYHHIIMDGWSTNLWLKDFLTLYENEAAMKEAEMVSRHYPYGNFLAWLEVQDITAAHDYWRDYLGTIEQVTHVRPSSPPAEAEYLKREYSVDVPRETYDRLSGLARTFGVTLNNVLQGVWGVVLHRYSGSDDVLFGNVVSGRNIQLEGIDRITGLFINTIPMRIEIDDARQKTFTRMLVQIRDGLMESQEYAYLQLADVQGYASVEGPLFDHIYIYENYPVNREIASPEQAKKTGFKLTRKYSTERTNYDLNVIVIPRRDLLVRFVYNENVYDRSFIAGLAGHVQQVMAEVLLRPDRSIADIEMVTEEEKQQLLNTFNDTDADYPRAKTIRRLFEEQVARTPDAVALEGKNRAYNSYLSYSGLNRTALEIAALLRAKGIRPGDIVAIMLERSVEMIVGIYGIIAAGAAYLPIDPDYPRERVDYVLRDSGAGVLLTDRESDGEISAVNHVISLRGTHPALRAPLPGGDLQWESAWGGSLAYVIYTSGSTGKPKGVMVEHRPLVNRLNWMQKKYPIGAGDTILHKTPFTFDVSVWEIFWWSVVGARVSLLGPGGEKDPRQIVDAVHRGRVTVIHFVPSMLNLFLDFVAGTGAAAVTRLASLKQVVVSGEALTVSMVETFNRLLGKNRTALANLYGPTEATVDVSYYDCPAGGDIDRIPIGKPIDNTQLLVLTATGRLQPPGVPGELCIAGHGLARGYLNNPDLTNQKFCGGPGGGFSKEPPGRRRQLYRTGDLARWLPDPAARGPYNLEYLGRIDHQVKIRGNRIELGEIETVLNTHPVVKESVAAVFDDKTGTPGEKNLCAYIVPGGDSDITVEQLRDHLAASLPEYMIPSYFVQIETIPLTSSGKADRKSLPAPDQRIRTGTEYTPPTDETEKTLVSIWREILKIDEIGIHHNFFSLGGHSLRVMTLAAQIRKTFHVELSLRRLFDNPTIARIAEIIRGKNQVPARFEEILQEIEALTEDQVRDLLN